jgi:hypothetical protein
MPDSESLEMDLWCISSIIHSALIDSKRHKHDSHDIRHSDLSMNWFQQDYGLLGLVDIYRIVPATATPTIKSKHLRHRNLDITRTMDEI